MLTCRELIEFLDRYLNGGLSFGERFIFKVHLFLCPACRCYLKSYKKTIQLSKTAFQDPAAPPPPPMPEAMIKAILAARKDPPEQK